MSCRLPVLSLLPLALLGLAGCVVSPTEIALPAALSDGEILPIQGTNGAMVGQVRLGDAASGRFTRTKTETTTLGTYKRDGATTRFTLEGAGLARAVEVDCQVKRRAVTMQGVSVPTQPVTYDCALSRGGRLKLDEEWEVAGPHPFPVRKGFVSLDETRLAVRSLHEHAGLERESLSPIGYSFAADDRVVGAVRLLMPPSLVIAPGATPEQRAAMMAAGAALALTWEPGA